MCERQSERAGVVTWSSIHWDLPVTVQYGKKNLQSFLLHFNFVFDLKAARITTQQSCVSLIRVKVVKP